jgi:Tol biopolymer transport system component
MKKVFYSSLGFLLLVLIFLVAYNFVFKNNVNNPTVEQGKKITAKENPLTDTEPIITSITTSINEDVMGTTASPDGFIYYYSLDEKALKKASLEGKDKSTLLSNLPGTPTRIVWSPKKDRVLLSLKQPNGQALWHFADLTTKTLVPLKGEISRIAWSNLGDKIFYQYTDPGSVLRTLNVSNPDGTAWKKLTAVSSDTFIAPIPQSASVSFWSRPNALEKTSFESIGSTGENRKVLLSEKYGADYLWSPNGEKVLVSTSVEKGGKSMLLNIMNANGGEFQSLAIPTLVSKVVWAKDSKTIYYALPGSIPENAVLPNDYFDKPIYTKDTFWKMDTLSGKKSRLADLKEVTQNFDSSDLFLSPNEDILFFTDRSTHRLYRIDI